MKTYKYGQKASLHQLPFSFFVSQPLVLSVSSSQYFLVSPLINHLSWVFLAVKFFPVPFVSQPLSLVPFVAQTLLFALVKHFFFFDFCQSNT